MTEETEPALADQLVTPTVPEIRKRLDPFEYLTVKNSEQEEFEGKGWEVAKANKKSLRMRREKPLDVAFEDQVWALLASVGFDRLSPDRHFTVSYGKTKNQEKQIDVLAVDEDVVLVVECKSTNSNRTDSFKKETEALKGIKPGLIKSLRDAFPGRKIKFIFATRNYRVTQESLGRLSASGVIHLGEKEVEYYLELAKHLGIAAKYQFLGSLFHGEKIENLETDVAAVRGKMGGHSYFTFLIEPSRLLKLTYILHRRQGSGRHLGDEAGHTYQRLIKKSRLKSVGTFVSEGGFFANGLVINIAAGKKKLRFEPLRKTEGGATLGVLELPPVFASVHIIDGQHRLFGFASSERADTELIPVVAFERLPLSDQVELFVQINENQKKVSKTLRDTLSAELLWGSDDFRERSKAIVLRLALDLGEEGDSPLLGRVLVGEEKTTAQRCISMGAISRGLEHGGFIGDFSRQQIKEPGTFLRTSEFIAGDLDPTYDRLKEFIFGALERYREALPEQWELGGTDGGFVFRNTGIDAFLRVLGDVVASLRDRKLITPESQAVKPMLEKVDPYINALAEELAGLPPEEQADLRGYLGSGAAPRYWRALQRLLAARFSDLDPPGLAQWEAEQEELIRKRARDIADEIEQFLSHDIREKLIKYYGEDEWFRLGTPKSVYDRASKAAVERNRELPKKKQLEPWDCLHLVDYKEILRVDNEVWVELFEGTYTLDGEEKNNDWKSKTSWLNTVKRIRDKAAHQHKVEESEYEELADIVKRLGL